MSESKNTTEGKSSTNKILVFMGTVFTPLAIFIVAQLVAAAALSIFIPGIFDQEIEVTILENFIYAVSFELLALGFVWLILKWRKYGLSWLGLGAWPKWENMWLVFPAAGVYILAAVVSFVIIGLLNTGVDLDQEQVVGFESASGSLQLGFAFLSLVILTPLTEEVLMRGFMFRNLNRTFGFVFSALVSAAIFGVLHGQINLFIDTFVLGLVLAWLVNKTNSLWPAIGLHSLKNAIAFLFLFVF